eukprot:scaffold144100_cov133-Phaeocystis_antarctica.AAC.4
MLALVGAVLPVLLIDSHRGDRSGSIFRILKAQEGSLSNTLSVLPTPQARASAKEGCLVSTALASGDHLYV